MTNARHDTTTWLTVLCGLPGSGKTTRASALAQERGAVRLCADEWLRALDLDLFDATARSLVESQLTSLATDLLRLGQHVVLEHGGWREEERAEMLSDARDAGAAVEILVLDLPVDELWSRLERRNGMRGEVVILREQLEHYAAGFERPDDRELARYDVAIVHFD
jgi:predicted kinase